jgi:AraC-like DNA-binding protein
MPTKSIFDIEERASDSPFVASVWRTTSGTRPGGFTSVAESHWSIVLTRQGRRTRLTIRGPETRATPCPIPAEAEFMGIAFNHGAFLPGLPADTLIDAALDLPASRDTFHLFGERWDLPDFENADDFVACLVRESLLVQDCAVVDALKGRFAGLSLRTLQRRFLRSTGLTPGTLFQIERARQAATMLERGIPILDAVEKAGYADQPHLTRAMRRFWGYTPAQLLRGAS